MPPARDPPPPDWASAAAAHYNAPVTRTFNPRDVGRVIQLQAHGTSLDVESTVLTRRAPLAPALAGWLHWPGGDRWTLVSDGPTVGAPRGFVQARRRGHSAEADVTFIAPGLQAVHGAAHTWQRLLGDASVALGQAGVGRLFAAIRMDDALAGQVLQQAGFAPFEADTVYQRAAPLDGSAAGAPTGASSTTLASSNGASPSGIEPRTTVRRYTASDRPALLSVLTASQPESARSHESAWTRWMAVPASAGSRRERWRVVADGRGRVSGAVRMVVGREAVWLSVAGVPGAADVDALFALALGEAGRIRPGGAVWTAVADRAPALAAAATAAGFVPVLRRQRSVRQTGLQRIAPRWREAKRAVPQASSGAITHARPRARERVHSLPGEGT